MNIHPIFVHFPIALLAMYSIFEILPLVKWYPKAHWDDIKAALVIFGGLGVLAALATGQLAEGSDLARASEAVLHVHKMFAGATAAVFGILAAAYLLRWIFEKHGAAFSGLATKFSFLKSFADFILNRWIVVPLALIGLIVLMFTGALGAIIVYGQNGDVVTQAVYSLFFR